jgi:bacterioferritin
MELGEVEYVGEDIKEGLERQIEKETEGIEEYERQIEIIDDDEVVGVLRHIVDEEKRHRKEFRERIARL